MIVSRSTREQRKSEKNSMYRIQLSLLLAGVLGFFAPGCSSGAKTETGKDNLTAAPRVETIHAEKKPIKQSLESHAQIRAFEESPLFARVTGYVSRINVDLGDSVHGPAADEKGEAVQPGQVLLELALPDIQEQVSQKAALVLQAEAESSQASAGVKLAEASLATAESKVSESEAAINRAKSSYQKWKSEYDRMVELAGKSAVTGKVVEESRDQTQAALATMQEAEAKHRSALATVRESVAALEKTKADVTAKEAHVRVAKANHQESLAVFAFGTLRAPFNGIVTRRNADVGHLVQSGLQREPLLVIARIDVLRLAIDIPEGDADLADIGDEVSIRVPALGNEVMKAKIARTAGSLSQESRTLRVEVDVPNPNGRLRPGMYANVIVTLAETTDALVIPTSAVFVATKQSMCVAIEDGKVIRKPLTLGLKSGSEIEVRSGLDGTEQIARTNAANLTEGLSVNSVPYTSPKP
jgi:RND family efflux transporter MFP subunit